MSANPTGHSGAGLTPGYRYHHGHTHYLMVPCMHCGVWRTEIVEHPASRRAPVPGHRFWVGQLCGARLLSCRCQRTPVMVQAVLWEAAWSHGWHLQVTEAYLNRAEVRP